jgi:hypothetical protein
MNTILAEDKFGHGALPSIKDLRDKKWSKLAMASTPFDWTAGFVLPPITITKNQGTSGSCGGQSGSYLTALFESAYNERSAKYLYSQIFYPPSGGTTMRDILNLIVKKGSAPESLVPSYQGGNPPSESFMEDVSLNANADASATAYEGTGYAFVNPDIESYAQAIRDNGGAIMEIQAMNNGTWLSADPQPPTSAQWAHFLICTGALMRNGKKVIQVKNSWGNEVGENGYQYISEDYFKSGFILQGGVVYQKSNPIVIQEKIGIIQQLIALLQKWINLLQGPTKQVL